MIIAKNIDRGFFLEIYLTQNLELTDIGDRIRTYVLRMELEKVQNISKEFRPGWAEATMEVISENNNLSIFGFWSFLQTRNPPMNDILSW